MVAAPEPLEHRHSATAEDACLAGLRSGLELELDLSVEGRNRDLSAECSLRHRQVDRRVDVVALAHESRMGTDADEHVQVARLPTEQPGMAFA